MAQNRLCFDHREFKEADLKGKDGYPWFDSKWSTHGQMMASWALDTFRCFQWKTFRSWLAVRPFLPGTQETLQKFNAKMQSTEAPPSPEYAVEERPSTLTKKMMKLYHYTSKENGQLISFTREIRPTIKQDKGKDAFYGSGVYLTILPPLSGYKEKILQNNWNNTKCFHKADVVIEIDIPEDDDRVEACDAGKQRFIHIYRGTINLENYSYDISEYDDKNIDTEKTNISALVENPLKEDGIKRKKEKLAKLISKHFYKSVVGDLTPWYAIQPLFGYQLLIPYSTPGDPNLRKAGAIMLGVWRGLFLDFSDYGDFNEEVIAACLIQGNLDEKFQGWIGGMPGESGYTRELKRRGFASLTWETLDRFIAKYTPCEDNSNALIDRCDVCSKETSLRCSKCKRGRFCPKDAKGEDLLDPNMTRVQKTEGKSCQGDFWHIHKILCKNID